MADMIDFYAKREERAKKKIKEQKEPIFDRLSEINLEISHLDDRIRLLKDERKQILKDMPDGTA